MDDTERRLFEQAVGRATGTHTGPALDDALAELGWLDALVTEPETAIAVVFDLQGAANAISSALHDVLLVALGLDAGGAVVLPALRGWDPPGSIGAGLSVSGLGLRGLAGSESVTVVAHSDAGDVAVTVPRRALTVTSVLGMDPDLGLTSVAGEIADRADRHTLPPGAWSNAVDHARLALAYELLGAAGAMLELARTHALDRVQFGRSIASFQAVRHRLAETYVALEGTRALLASVAEGAPSEYLAMAKAVAGRTARLAARHCQQVLAGIGFTTEHPLHRYVKRVLVLDELFGSSRVLTRDLGQRLASGTPLPAPIPL